MIAEIISVGTELLLGQIVNTNAAYIAEKLSWLGINTYHQSVVGDNPNKMIETIKIAEERSDLLLFIGGLGPTQDDLTKQTVAAHIDEPLELDADTVRKIKKYFADSGREMTENNKQQALFFSNGRLFQNEVGQAVGTTVEKKGKHYLMVPGPPHEMKNMFQHEIYPYLESLIEENRQFILSKTLHFYGIGESMLAERLHDMIEEQTNPTLAPYAGNNEVSLRLTASGKDEDECKTLLEIAKNDILKVVGAFYYGEGSDLTLAKVVTDLLEEKGLTISAAESLTGGLFQSTIVSVPECGKVFLGGIVSYDESIKRDVLGVSEDILEEEGMVSEACAIDMAERCRKMFKSDVAISFTGAAGPEPLQGEPAGVVWIGYSQEGYPSFAKKYRFMHDRNGNRQHTVLQGLDLIYRTLAEK